MAIARLRAEASALPIRPPQARRRGHLLRTVSTIKQRSVGTFQGRPSGRGVLYGVVRDGITTVTQFPPARAVTGRVVANVYIVRYPG